MKEEKVGSGGWKEKVTVFKDGKLMWEQSRGPEPSVSRLALTGCPSVKAL